jgi:hypothetical protein
MTTSDHETIVAAVPVRIQHCSLSVTSPYTERTLPSNTVEKRVIVSSDLCTDSIIFPCTYACVHNEITSKANFV